MNCRELDKQEWRNRYIKYLTTHGRNLGKVYKMYLDRKDNEIDDGYSLGWYAREVLACRE